MAAHAPFIYRCRKKVRVITRVRVVTITTSSDGYGMEIFLCVISPVMTPVAEVGRIANQKSAESRTVGVMAGGALAFGNRRMDVGILKFGFLVTAVAEIGHIPDKFHAAFLLRMRLVLRCDMAGAATYSESAVVIFRRRLEFHMTIQTRDALGCISLNCRRFRRQKQ